MKKKLTDQSLKELIRSLPDMARAGFLRRKYFTNWRAIVKGKKHRLEDPRHQAPSLNYTFYAYGNEVYTDLKNWDREDIRKKHLRIIGVGYLSVFRILSLIYDFNNLDPQSPTLPKLIIADPSAEVHFFWMTMKHAARECPDFKSFKIIMCKLIILNNMQIILDQPLLMNRYFDSILDSVDINASYQAFREMVLRATLAPCDWSNAEDLSMLASYTSVDPKKTAILIYASNLYEFMKDGDKREYLSGDVVKLGNNSYTLLENIAALNAHYVLHARTPIKFSNDGLIPHRALMFSGDCSPENVQSILENKQFLQITTEQKYTPSTPNRPR